MIDEHYFTKVFSFEHSSNVLWHNVQNTTISVHGSTAYGFCNNISTLQERPGKHYLECIHAKIFVFSPLACPANLYGASCTENCLCLNGGTCDPYQGCVCPLGWSGPSCKTCSYCSGPEPEEISPRYEVSKRVHYGEPLFFTLALNLFGPASDLVF